MDKNYDLKECAIQTLVSLCLKIERETDNFVSMEFSNHGFDIVIHAKVGNLDPCVFKMDCVSAYLDITDKDFPDLYHKTLDRLSTLVAVNRKDGAK